MRETTRSLGLFFMLTGGWGVLMCLFVGLALMTQMPGGAALGSAALMGISGLVSAVNLWVGWNLARLLVERPHIPIRFATLSLLLSVVTFSVIGGLLNLYILVQLKRLAKEADVKLESRTLE